MGFRTTQILYVAAKLELADRIAAQPRTAAELAPQVRAHRDALHRLLRALTALELLEEARDRRFSLTAMGELLRSDVPGSIRNVALVYGEKWVWQAYGKMLYSVETGEPAFPAAHGQGVYEFLNGNEAAGTVFQAAMDSFSAAEAAAIIDAYRFNDANLIVERRFRTRGAAGLHSPSSFRAQGVAFDLPSVEPECVRRFEDAGLTSLYAPSTPTILNWPRSSARKQTIFTAMPYVCVIRSSGDSTCSSSRNGGYVSPSGRVFQVCSSAVPKSGSDTNQNLFHTGACS
jgi:hypothetical protein